MNCKHMSQLTLEALVTNSGSIGSMCMAIQGPCAWQCRIHVHNGTGPMCTAVQDPCAQRCRTHVHDDTGPMCTAVQDPCAWRCRIHVHDDTGPICMASQINMWSPIQDRSSRSSKHVMTQAQFHGMKGMWHCVVQTELQSLQAESW